MLDETHDEQYVYKLECLYEFWRQEQPIYIIIQMIMILMNEV